MSKQANRNTTLGSEIKKLSEKQSSRLLHVFLAITVITLLGIWVYLSPSLKTLSIFFCILILIFAFFKYRHKTHILIANDQQRFMGNLKLSDKTALIDGSNIYHFGLQNQVGSRALEVLVQGMRSDGFRVVCFFDANIYFTLRENNAFQKTRRKFSIKILQNLFGLKASEIYVVPSGTQADEFIIESLQLLPISFAVTNDRYRDYGVANDFLVKDTQWRKGVTMNDGELRLYQHSFKNPLVIYQP